MPPKRDYTGYQYSNMSSLVLSADRSQLPRRENEPTGEPETLVGRIDPKAMGSRAFRQAPETEKKKKKMLERRGEGRDRDDKRRKAEKGGQQRYRDILEATQEVEGLVYRPKTAQTREVYELMLSLVHQPLGDVPQDMVRSATDEILQTLKTDTLKDLDKKKEIESLLGGISNETFTQFVNLGKKITDFSAGGEDDKMDPDKEKKEGEIDEDVGVAVVFEDEDEEEEEEDGAGYEVNDESEDEEDEEGGGEGDKLETIKEENEAEEEEEILIGGESLKRAEGKKDPTKVEAHDIDGFWLQRLIAHSYPDPLEAAEKTSSAMSLMTADSNIRDLENALMDLFDYDKFELVKILTKNRDLIVWCTKLARSDEDERVNVEVAMREKGVGWILKELQRDRGIKSKDLPPTIQGGESMEVDEQPMTKKLNLQPGSIAPPPRQQVDLDSMAFSQGARLMSNKKCKLPEGSFKRSKKGYEEIHIPAPKPHESKPGDFVLIETLPGWAQAAFKGYTKLNLVQSKIQPIAMGTDEPILLCAPTGAGKTNVALLTILHEMEKHMDENGKIDLNGFKVVYIAPMKALVQEQVGQFSSRLKEYGIQVGELTGDRQMTKQQISETQIIVTTPEKWDVITRKNTDTSYTNLVRLIIIDEIHLLHDDRGPVLEAVVARTIRRMEQTGDDVRLVGLSATLPNYKDVAKFLRVNPDIGLFYFDSTTRPCPLRQEFIGVTEKKAIQRYQVMNEVCYEKVLDQTKQQNQVIVFVHSRKDTAKTARALCDLAIEREEIASIVQASGAVREILQTEAEVVSDPNLKHLLPFGFAIHHAGMTRVDRGSVEDLFAQGTIRVLVSTATLAWGVNLPAHAVIIKGTQIYNPEKGRWVELSPQDVLQMLGRAGRPQYDVEGEGYIITNHSELQYYLSMLNQQLPIESQLVSKLADNLNAEVALGTIRNRDEAVQWLGYTYLYQRMLRSPTLYGVGVDYDDDANLIQKRSDIIHSAANILEKCQLVKYERKTGILQPTELGRIASHYYISHSSMSTYNQHLRSGTLGYVELFRVFALSEEFKFIPVRQDEKLELAKLMDRVPIPIKESIEEPTAKINVLLQAYISQLSLEGFALLADMVYITQSAGRILRALFEISLKRGWAGVTHKALDLCKMVERRMWTSMTPLRQFSGIPIDIVRRAERKEFPWYRYFDLDPAELGELIGLPKSGRKIHQYVHQFPNLELQAHLYPITRSMLRIELTITPDFQWDEKQHGGAQTFWILVEDVDGEIILYHDQFVLHQRYADEEHYVTFTVPMMDPLPPNYFISVVSDKWLQSETKLPVSFKHLILPDKFPPPTALLDLQPLPIAALHNPEFQQIYAESIQSFNKIQTQVFQALYTTNDNVFVGAPTGSGKTICAEFALMHLWSQAQAQRCVCLLPFAEQVEPRVKEWQEKFSGVQGGKVISALTGEVTADLRLLEKADVVVCTPFQWDQITRRWRKRATAATIGLLIADDIHMIGSEFGPTYEIVVSRTRYIIAETDHKTRIIALGVSLANAREIGEWIGAPNSSYFNFSPGARPLPMEVHLQSFNIPHFASLMIQMAKPAYLAIVEWAEDRPVIAFVPSRKQCALTANDLLLYCLSDQNPDRFLNIEVDELEKHLEHIKNLDLKETLRRGIGFYHEALDPQDRLIVQRLYESGAIQVVVASKDIAWSIPMTAYMVIIMGVQNYQGREHRYVDYPFTDVLQMMGRACRPLYDSSSRCVLMCHQSGKEFFKKFLNEGLPIESHLHLSLHDHINAEIVEKTIKNKQEAVDYTTWLFLYRRLVANPNYYNMQGNSHRHLSDYLSNLVETTVEDLQTSNAISIKDEMDLEPLNLGIIASYYNINYLTLDLFALSLTDKTKLKGLLEILSSANEFETLIPIRHREDSTLRKIYDRVRVKSAKPNFSSPHLKTNILLQAHFSRLQLPSDLAADQTLVLGKVINLLSACIDVMSSNGHLNAIAAMELSQSCIQALWDDDSPLRQIPHFTSEVIARCQAAGVQSVYDVSEMEDEERNKVLQMDNRQMKAVAGFVNSYPNIELNYEIQDQNNLDSATPVVIDVTLEREGDDEDFASDQVVAAPFFPSKKIENWFLVVGEPSTKTLLYIKRVTVQKRIHRKLEFNITKGDHDLKLYLICDSYLGADQEFDFKISVAEGEQDESDDDSDEDMEDA